MKKILAVMLLVTFIMPVVAFAEEKITDVGNKLCPISGEPVSGTTFVTYQGKRYGLCCPGCKGPFLADPEKYIAHMKMKASAPASDAAAAAADAAKSKTMQKDMEQGSL